LPFDYAATADEIEAALARHEIAGRAQLESAAAAG
jgi:hypothetical protein